MTSTPGDYGTGAGGYGGGATGYGGAGGYSGAGSAGATGYTESGHPDVSNVSVGQLIGDVTRDLSTLIRQEMELAKAELKAEAGKAGKGAGMLGGAGFAGYLFILFLSLALAYALGTKIGFGWGALIVGVLWGIIAAVLFLVGRGNLRSVNPKPERTVQTTQQIPQALKPNP
jgi:hypothetical protein